MKKYIILIIGFMLSCGAMNAEIILKGNPQRSDASIKVEIDNPSYYENNYGNTSLATVISYSYNLQKDAPIIMQNDAYISKNTPISVSKASDAEFVIIQIFYKDEFDSYAEVLPVLVHNGSTPVQNANYLKSLYETNALTDFNNINLNFAQAQMDINSELKYYQNSIPAQLTKMSMNKQANFDLKEIEKICPSFDELSEKELTILYNIYKGENDKDNSDKISKLILRKYPLGSFSEQNFYTTLASKKNNDYIRMASLFIQQFPNSSKRSEVTDKIAQIYIENNDLKEASKVLQAESYLPPYQSLRLAFAYLEKRNDKTNAEATFQAIIDRLSNKNTLPKNNTKPAYLWDIEIKDYLAETYRAYGEYYLQTRKPQMATKYFDMAEKTFSNPPAKLYENQAIAFYNSRSDIEALNATERAFSMGYDTKIIREINEKVYNSLYRNRDYRQYYDSLSYASKIQRQNQLARKLIDTDIKLPVLRNLDGVMVDLSLMKKDIMVIELFASWCEPCENSLLSFAEINKSLKKNNNVAMIAINTFENDKLDKKIFRISDLNGLEIFFDDYGDFARSIGVTGLPVRIFIDKYGKVRYIQSGAIGKTEDIRETKDVMELINSMQ